MLSFTWWRKQTHTWWTGRSVPREAFLLKRTAEPPGPALWEMKRKFHSESVAKAKSLSWEWVRYPQRNKKWSGHLGPWLWAGQETKKWNSTKLSVAGIKATLICLGIRWSCLQCFHSPDQTEAGQALGCFLFRIGIGACGACTVASALELPFSVTEKKHTKGIPDHG